MKQKYNGTINELKDVVKSAGIQGEWESEGSKQTFRSVGGGILNWWPNGTVQFQGKPDVKAVLERTLEELLAREKANATPATTTAENGSEPRPGIGSESRPQLAPLVAGRYCLDDRSLKRINEALLASGDTIILVSDSLHVVNEAEFDCYRSLVVR